MSAPLAKLERIPASVASVADYEPLARERMTEAAWAWLAGGAADEITLQENAAAFRRLQLRTRILRDLSGGNTRLELFGHRYDFPVLLAPVAYQKLAHPEGETATALAAAANGVGMVVSTQASIRLEDIARSAPAPLWFQLYMQPDRDFTLALVRRAEAAGYSAIALTADAPVSGPRNREQRAGFALPPGVEAANLSGRKVALTQGEGREDALLLGGPLLSAAPTWRDLDWLRAQTKLPLVLKGVMTGFDAAQAVAAGVDAIVVSNHGGRSLDTQPATVDVLPEIAAAVADRVPLLLDGGIRRGTDVFKALAFGASAVLIGRAFMFGLATAGAVGVSHVLRLLRAELEIAMALTGCRDLHAIDSSCVRSATP